LKIALSQMAPKLGDTASNLARHLEIAARARRSGADLAIFPELSLTGYQLQDLVSDVAEEAPGGRSLRKLAAASKPISIVAGFAERGPGQRLHNAAGFFSSGRLAHVHRKVYLPTYGMFDEGRYFAAGSGFESFDAPWGRTGLLICEDFWHLSSAYLLALQGLDLLVVISASPVKALGPGKKLRSAEIWKELGVVVARHLTCWVAYVNRAGYEDGWAFQGGSYLCSPAGEVHAEAGLLKEELVIAELPEAEIRRARLRSPLLRDEKEDLVRRELERIVAGRASEGES